MYMYDKSISVVCIYTFLLATFICGSTSIIFFIKNNALNSREKKYTHNPANIDQGMNFILSASLSLIPSVWQG